MQNANILLICSLQSKQFYNRKEAGCTSVSISEQWPCPETGKILKIKLESKNKFDPAMFDQRTIEMLTK
jgi:hypothetical protein